MTPFNNLAIGLEAKLVWANECNGDVSTVDPWNRQLNEYPGAAS
jgi:hypothetical protein